MPHYKLTGYHSHRHPFLGVDDPMVQLAGPGDEGNLIDLDNPFAPGIYEALAQDVPAQPPQAISINKVIRPFLQGVVGGLVVYGIARRYATPKAAQQIGLVFGGASVLLGFATDYVYREMQALQSAAPGTEGEV